MGIFDFFKSSESKEKDFISKYGGAPIILYAYALEKVDHKAIDEQQEYISIGWKSEFRLDNIPHWENVFKNKFVEQLKSGDLTIKDLELKIKNFELIKNVTSEYLSNLKKIGQKPLSMYSEHINLAKSVISGAKLALKEISLNPVENNKKSNPKTTSDLSNEPSSAMDSNKLPKHIIHPKGDAQLKIQEADANWLGLDFTPDMENAYKNGLLKRLKSEYNVTNQNEYYEKVDNIDWVWCCADVTAHSFNFDFGLKKEDYKDESDYHRAIADKWEHYFHNSEEQVIINLCSEYLSSYLE